MRKDRSLIRKVRIGFLLLEGAVILLLTAAGFGLLRHDLPLPGYCTFGSIPLILAGIELIYGGIKKIYNSLFRWI